MGLGFQFDIFNGNIDSRVERLILIYTYGTGVSVIQLAPILMGEYLDILKRNQNFRYLWWGNVISLLGDWFNLIASAALVTELTSSGVAIIVIKKKN